ncbi:MAG TPA: acyltransferase family protein, partial [Polyangia bacterium]
DFYLLPSRFWELLAGCALALPSSRRRRFADLKALVGLAMLVTAALLLDHKARFPGWWATLPTGAACLFISAGPDAAFNRHVLSHRLMVFIGVISYPLYLWHWPLLSILRDTAGAEPSAGARLGVVAVSVLLAVLTWRFVEKPIQRHFSFRGMGFGKGPAFAILASLAMLGILAVCGIAIERDALMSRDQRNNPLAYQLQKYAVYDNTPTRINHCFVDTAIAFGGFAEDCYIGDPQKAHVMLLGDSHAAHLYPGLVETLRGSNVDLLQMNASNCPPLIGNLASDLESCRQANELVFRTVHAQRPQFVILDAEWTSYFARPHIHAALAQTIRQLRDDGVERVVVIGPVPDWFSSLHQVLETKFLRAGAGLPSHTNVGLDPSALGVNDVLRRDATEAGATYISLTDRLCDAAGCITFVGPDVASDLIVYDTDHLTVAGARFVSRTIVAPALAELLHR